MARRHLAGYQRVALALTERGFRCRCGRLCPVRGDTNTGELVFDHGGEAIFRMAREDVLRLGMPGGYRFFRDTPLRPWLEAVHRYEGRSEQRDGRGP